jgi:hypothetical protein
MINYGIVQEYWENLGNHLKYHISIFGTQNLATQNLIFFINMYLCVTSHCEVQTKNRGKEAVIHYNIS